MERCEEIQPTKREELIEKMKVLDTTCLYDALDRFGIKGGCHGIVPSAKVAGTVFTVRNGPIGTSGEGPETAWAM